MKRTPTKEEKEIILDAVFAPLGAEAPLDSSAWLGEAPPKRDEVGWWWWQEPTQPEFRASMWECVLVAHGGFIRAGRMERWPVETAGKWGHKIDVPGASPNVLISCDKKNP